MRLAVVGGGPAGLYLAILMKRADPAHEVLVLERNPPDATFGWGVVFSEETLGALRDADPESHEQIGEAFATWNTIEIHHRGRVVRSRGHAFSAISRKRLLAILQARARELGAELRFETEIGEPPEADLVVAADGVNSTLRPQRALGTRIARYPSRFVWFGTDLVFDAFTFVFRDTGHGMFQVHAYPFDAETSTFIVECPEETWRRAGLEDAGEEETLRFCEELFADVLGTHRLLSNRSIWLQFAEVRNRSWHDGNVVVLGDAAHTAHFSIGSGTKLAMEDSVALARALARRRGLERALADYEMERRPVVERFQQAARESAGYFERVGRYDAMHPIQFAFNLLTRSGRISHANLTLRDPQFVRALDAWFAEDGREIAPPPMFAPLMLAGLPLRNRVVRTGEHAARAGAGLVLSGLVAVALEGRITPDTPTLDDDWPVDAVHRAGARIALQLTHAGRRGATRRRSEGADRPLPGGWSLLAPSPLPYAPGGRTPKEMDGADMARVREAFASAAARAAELGFDVLEIDLAHGYLLASFISKLTNRRDDEYGGDLEGRMRFPLEVLDAVRERWPEDRPLAARINGDDWARGGGGVEEAVAVARALSGCALVHVVAGQTVVDGRPEYRRGTLVALADRIRAEAGVAVLAGGHLTTADEVNTAVGAGRADLCMLEPAPMRTGLRDG